MNILITGAWKEAEINIEYIRKLGNEVTFMQKESGELPCDYEWVEGVICNGLFLYHSIDKFTHLEYIQLTSVGFDRAPLDYIKEANISLFNARGVYSVPIAETVILFILEIYKNSYFFFNNQNRSMWKKNRMISELNGKTIAILGVGSIGLEIAKRAKSFGTRIIGFDLIKKRKSEFDQMCLIDEFDNLIGNFDIVICCLPLTEKTTNFFDEKRLGHFNPNAILINISRGGIVDENALYNLLKEKRIKGAALDVFENEPLTPESPLWKLENIIITPHNSFVSNLNDIRLNDLILTNLREYKIRKVSCYE